MDDLPIVCDLTPDEIQARRDGLLPGLLSEACERVSVTDGYRWRFDSSADLLARVGHTIDAERRCCRFLRFVLTVEPGGGSVWLEITGPAGTATFLDTLSHLPAPAK